MDSDGILLLGVVLAIVCGLMASIIAGNKGHSYGAWFVVGFLFSIFGLLASVLVSKREQPINTTSIRIEGKPWKCPKCNYVNSYLVNYCQNRIERGDGVKVPCDFTMQPEEVPSEKKCPDCAETIKFEAKVCRFCGYRFSPVS